MLQFRTQHNEELHNLYRSPCTVRVLKSRQLTLAGHVIWTGKGYRILVAKPLGKQPAEKTEKKMGFREVRCGDGTLNELAQYHNGQYTSVLVTEPLCSITNKLAN
jgi:hypothetical protein